MFTTASCATAATTTTTQITVILNIGNNSRVYKFVGVSQIRAIIRNSNNKIIFKSSICHKIWASVCFKEAFANKTAHTLESTSR